MSIVPSNSEGYKFKTIFGGWETDSNSIRQESSPVPWVKVIHVNQLRPETYKLLVSCWGSSVWLRSHTKLSMLYWSVRTHEKLIVVKEITTDWAALNNARRN